MLKVLGEDSGKFKAVASGTLPNGKPVVVNSDGTVSVVDGVIGGTGTPTQFESGSVQYMTSTFDSSNNKVVIIYRDAGNSDYGAAVVGTVSGTSISFGSPVVFNSAQTTYPAATFDSNSNKVVIAYLNGFGVGGTGRGIVGTVSGTSISFGSATEFDSNQSNEIAATFDSNSNKVVIAYSDDNGTEYGTAVVGTVSGTSISFGSAVVFESAVTTAIGMTFDTNSNKVVIAYEDNGNSRYGTAIVGTVSGTSISFGTAVVYESSRAINNSPTFDSNSNKVVIAYRDSGNLQYGTVVVGTVSGTSISFGTPVIFEAAASDHVSSTFDSSTNKVVIAYEDGGNSNAKTAIVGTVSGTSISFDAPEVLDTQNSDYMAAAFDSNSNKVVVAYDYKDTNGADAIVYGIGFTNLTSENYIGISSGGAVADTGNATVDIIGTVNKDQTGLTAGQKYYVQTDGTLSTTAGSPSVLAGTAITSSKLLVKT